MIKVGTWKVTAGRNVKRCGFTHVTPAWWPRLVLTWEDAPRYENGRWWPARTVNGCIRHTRAAHRWLTFMGTPSKIGPCDDSPDWKHARDELLAAHAAHDLPVIGCVACEAIDPGNSDDLLG